MNKAVYTIKLIEELWRTTKVNTWNKNLLNIYKNPSRNDRGKLIKQTKEGMFSFLALPKDKTIYLWDRYLALHGEIVDYLIKNKLIESNSKALKELGKGELVSTKTVIKDIPQLEISDKETSLVLFVDTHSTISASLFREEGTYSYTKDYGIYLDVNKAVTYADGKFSLYDYN